jgi:hypothetical protein
MKQIALPIGCAVLALASCSVPPAAAPSSSRSASGGAAAKVASSSQGSAESRSGRDSSGGARPTPGLNLSLPFTFGVGHAAAGRYRLSGSGSSLVLSDVGGSRLDTLPLNDGERPVRIKAGRGESFLVATSGGRIVKASVSSGKLRQTKRTPVLSENGAPLDFLEGKSGELYAVSRQEGRIQVNSLQGGDWKPNQAVSSGLSDFQTMKLDPATGQVAFLGKAPGSNQMTIIRSNASGSQTKGFLLPEGMGMVNDIAVINGEVYVASGWGRSGTLSVFGTDGKLKSSTITGELESLNVTYKNGEPVIQASRGNGETMEFDAGKPLEEQADVAGGEGSTPS